MYDPAIGRWFTEDPIGFDAGDADLYRYVANDPTNGIDPNGLEIETARTTVRTWSTPKPNLLGNKGGVDFGPDGKFKGEVQVRLIDSFTTTSGQELPNGISIAFLTTAPKDSGYRHGGVHFLQFVNVLLKKGGKIVPDKILGLGDAREPRFISTSKRENAPNWFVDSPVRNQSYYDLNATARSEIDHQPDGNEKWTNRLMLFDNPGAKTDVLKEKTAPWDGRDFDQATFNFSTFVIYNTRPIYCVTWSRTFTFKDAKWSSEYKVLHYGTTDKLSKVVKPEETVTQDSLPGLFTKVEKGEPKGRLPMKNEIPKESR
jgi:hypothetical protein